MCIRLSDSWLSEGGHGEIQDNRKFSAARHCLWRALLAVQLIVACFALSSPTPAQAASEPRPSSASIRTPDFDDSVAWYQEKLGFRLIGNQSLVPGRRAVLKCEAASCSN